MAIPKGEHIRLPLLKRISDRKPHHRRELTDALAEDFQLTHEQRTQEYPSGNGVIFDHRVAFAGSYLYHAGLLSRPERGVVQITKRGLEVLASRPENLYDNFLRQFPEFAEFIKPKKAKKADEVAEDVPRDSTPKESLEAALKGLNDMLSSELLEEVKSCTPMFFERLVVDLLIKMGYGGSRQEAGKAIGRSGDGGVDGIISEDRLGLDRIYIQAKRWDDTTVGRSEVQKFAGALQGKKAKKGVFITTSSFSKGARDYVTDIDSRIILIDGVELTSYMIEFSVGVSTESHYELKKIDEDYFAGE
ncbi:MAG: restriction endonuclease [candidate division Zixibacteria bacterium]|nr:restriction endonuclease [candidate division Zixibacteria bacterium]